MITPKPVWYAFCHPLELFHYVPPVTLSTHVHPPFPVLFVEKELATRHDDEKYIHYFGKYILSQLFPSSLRMRSTTQPLTIILALRMQHCKMVSWANVEILDGTQCCHNSDLNCQRGQLLCYYICLVNVCRCTICTFMLCNNLCAAKFTLVSKVCLKYVPIVHSTTELGHPSLFFLWCPIFTIFIFTMLSIFDEWEQSNCRSSIGEHALS